MKAVENIDQYIASFPDEVQEKLMAMRETIQSAAPQAAEAIKYAMPTFVLNGNLVHFAAFKKHIGFYPTPEAIVEFQSKLKGYEVSKGAIRFPLNEKLPLKLVASIVKFRVKRNKQLVKAKAR